MNKNTFWDNTTATWTLITENAAMHELVSLAVNEHCKEPGFSVNFNQDGSAFFVRTDKYAIRVGNKWGEVGNCNWSLDRDASPGKFQMAKLIF